MRALLSDFDSKAQADRAILNQVIKTNNPYWKTAHSADVSDVEHVLITFLQCGVFEPVNFFDKGEWNDANFHDAMQVLKDDLVQFIDHVEAHQKDRNLFFNLKSFPVLDNGFILLRNGAEDYLTHPAPVMLATLDMWRETYKTSPEASKEGGEEIAKKLEPLGASVGRMWFTEDTRALCIVPREGHEEEDIFRLLAWINENQEDLVGIARLHLSEDMETDYEIVYTDVPRVQGPKTKREKEAKRLEGNLPGVDDWLGQSNVVPSEPNIDDLLGPAPEVDLPPAPKMDIP
jgi:hypothetical protein